LQNLKATIADVFIGFISILGIQKVRIELTVLTSSNMLWLGIQNVNQTFADELEDMNIAENSGVAE
jgi:hypothetical protein